MLVVGSLFNLGCTALPAGLGLNPRFYMLDVLGMVLGLAVATLFANFLMKSQYQSDSARSPSSQTLTVSLGESEGVLDEGADKVSSAAGDAESQQDSKVGATCCNWLTRTGASLVTAILSIAYPLAVLPYYRAETTSDWARFVIVCVVHPLAQE